MHARETELSVIPPEPLLAIEHLTITLADGRNLVDDVSFSLAKGEIFALVGESGSGKSLTALSIMRLLPHNMNVEGRINLADEALTDLSERQMLSVRGGRIGMIFQEPMTALNPLMRVGAQIAEVLQLHTSLRGYAQKERVIALLNEVGIPNPQERMNWYPHQLSGGQKQRIMIAMALAGEPELLIADEPTTALDVTIQAQVLDLLLSIQQARGLAVLFITHDMGLVAQLAHRVGVMLQGKLLEVLPIDEFFQSAHHEYTKRLIANALPTQTFREAVVSQDSLLTTHALCVTFSGRRAGWLLKKQPDTIAVDGINLHIAKGETLALVGESGCGKTTLAQALLRLIPAQGQVFFLGQSLLALTERAMRPFRKSLQVVFQDPYGAFNPRMTVGNIIREGMDSLNVGKPEARQARVAELLTLVGLSPEHQHRYPHEFSGGQRQRIGIARALAVEPKLIICDEPTSALDVTVRGQILDLLDDLQQKMGVSYLFITHDLSIVPRIAHRVAVMQAGKIVEVGATEQVLRYPQQDYTKSLLASAPHRYLAARLKHTTS
jgi:peptide/nickel transport system ATP-binding protein